MEDLIASLAAAGLVLLYGRRNARHGDYGHDGRPSPMRILLVLEMMAVAVRQGASITRALESVSAVVDDELGVAVAQVTSALYRGVGWSEAWALACDDVTATGGSCAILRDCLETSWRLGASPLPRIEAIVSQLDSAERSRIESEAARLSIRLLLPTALCFLPAFMLLGVIPCIAAFAQGLFS
jgi:hypothetical protein